MMNACESNYFMEESMSIKKINWLMKHGSGIVLMVIILFMAASPGQIFARENGSDIIIGKTAQIKSQVLGEERSLLIYLPETYETSRDKYPVLYHLYVDDTIFHYSTGIVRFLADRKLIPPMIVVALSTNRQGARDLTPTKTPNYGPTSGGADNFIKFFKEELIPFIDKNYRTRPYRVIWSHSIVGTFSIYALLSAPGVFNAYLVSSPWFTYDGEGMFLLKNAEKFLKKRTTQENFLFITVGNEPELLPSIKGFDNILKNTAPKGLKWEYMVLKDENHNSMMSRCLQEGLRALYSNMKNQ